jgi:hypothetical protein
MTENRLPRNPSSILVSYRGAPAALVGIRRLSFLGDVRHLPSGHPLVRVVAYMAYYAQLVLREDLPGPYADGDAERFARYALIETDELRRRRDASDDVLAVQLAVPVEQIAAARLEGDDRHAR